MTLTIDLPPDIAQVLEERARRTGQSVAEFAAAVLAQLTRLGGEGSPNDRQVEIAERLAALDRIGSYDNRARAGLPPLDDDAVSRGSVYAEGPQ